MAKLTGAPNTQADTQTTKLATRAALGRIYAMRPNNRVHICTTQSLKSTDAFQSGDD